MKTIRSNLPGMVLGAASGLCLIMVLCGEPSAGEPGNREGNRRPAKVEEKNRVTVEVARERAKVMHDLYDATLDVIHHRYFHRDRSVIPARVMEDIFSQMKRQSDVEARWMSVNLTAMSVDHEPESDFEKQAVKEIAAGKPDFETVEGGYYRRAGAIPLTAGCVSCHAGLFKEPSQSPKYAALVISVPLIREADQP